MMKRKNNWFKWVISMFKEFLTESVQKPEYEILNIYTCPQTSFTKAEIKLSGRHIIEKTISDIVTDMNFLGGFDKKTIRTLTYMATVERMKPDYTIVVQQLGSEVDDFILEIRSRNGKEVAKKSPSEMSKNKTLLTRFSQADANMIGYLAGVKETVKEFKMKQTKGRKG